MKKQSGVGSMLAALGLLLLAVQGQGVQMCRKLTCETLNGFFAHPIECGSFIKCSNGKPEILHCPDGLHYNPLLNVCDYPEAAQCNVGERLKENGCTLKEVAQARLSSLPLAVDSSVLCDCDCCFKAHTDCTKYYECTKNGQVFERQCPHGLVYNPHIENCDFPGNYQCPTTTTTTPTTASPQICGCKCRYPVDGECNAFYDCNDGVAEKKYCSDGLFFNPSTQTCGPHCEEHSTTTPTVSGCDDSATDAVSDCKFWAANNDCVCKWTDGDCSWQHHVARTCPHACACHNETVTRPPPSKFPCVDCSKGQQYFQHPTDCRKFIQCAPYGPQEMPCGPKTVWDQRILTCNHEATTPCVTGNYIGSDGECVGCITNCGITTSPSKPEVTPVAPKFPCVDCSKGQQYFQHPTDCRKFIQCAPYGPQEMPCGPKTVWDQRILTCNHEATTPCVTGNYEGPGGECVGETHDPPTTTPEVTRPQTDECDISCPAAQGLFPHPRDCKKWVHCDHNIPYVKDCPGNLHFNPSLKVCDWPYRAGCTSGSQNSCQLPIPEPLPPTPLPPIVDPRCDCECCHKPAPDCTSYYYCDINRELSFHTCSPGLVFSSELSTCVYASDYPECPLDPPPVCLCDCFYPSKICTSYFSCVVGEPIKLECPGGLFWNNKKKTCDLPELVDCTMPALHSK